MIPASGEYYIRKYGMAEGVSRMVKHGILHIDLDLTDTENEYYSARDDEFLLKLLDLKRKISDGGASVCLVRGPVRALGNDAERAESFEKMTKAMVMARHLGARYMTLPALAPKDGMTGEEATSKNLEYFSALASVAGGLGVTVCLENTEDKSNPLASPVALLSLIEEINHPSLALSLDTAKAISLGIDPSEAITILGKRLLVIHGADSDGFQGSRLPLFSGGVDWMQVAEAIFESASPAVFSVTVDPIPKTEEPTEAETELLEQTAASYAKLICL